MTDAAHLAALLARLNPEQTEAALFDDGQLLVLAPAGTGKTDTMTVRIARLIGTGVCAPEAVLALTFTTKAARELKTRIGRAVGRDRMPKHVGTFHAVCLEILKENPKLAGLKPGFEIAGEDKLLEIVKAAMAKAGHPTKKKNRFAADPVKPVADKFARIKDDGFRPADAALWLADFVAANQKDAKGCEAARIAADIAPAVQASLRRRNLCDFSDMVLWPTLALEEDAAFRAAWAGRFRYVVVDEYQDVNAIQYRFARASASVHGNIVAVGDDDQNLYAFRGSSPEYILRFMADWPGARCVTLFRNYRSTRPILDAANRLIAHNAERHEKRMESASGADGVPVTATECRDAAHEAETVVRAILTRDPDIPLDRCAVLYRAAYQGRVIEDMLRKEGVGFGVIGGTSFYRRKEVLDALALLTLADAARDAASNDSFRRVVNVPARGIGPMAVAEVAAEADRRGLSLFAAAEELVEEGAKVARGGLTEFVEAVHEANFVEGGLGELLDVLLEATGYRAMLEGQGAAGRERLENVAELRRLADRFADALSLLEHCEAAAQEAEAAAEFGQVQLTTVHGAKGLEFDMVCIVGCADDQFPSARSVKEGKLEEERRLAYVAITRARRVCMLTWPRRGEGRKTASEASRFIAEAGIEPVRLQEGFVPSRSKGRRRSWRKARPAPRAARPRREWEPQDRYWER